VKIKIDPIDALFSKMIRQKNPICEVCHRARSSQVHHFKGRRYQSVRFSKENAWAVCFTCHRKFHEDPEWGVMKMKQRLGEDYDKFILKASYVCRRKDVDKKAIQLWIQKEMEKKTYD